MASRLMGWSSWKKDGGEVSVENQERGLRGALERRKRLVESKVEHCVEVCVESGKARKPEKATTGARRFRTQEVRYVGRHAG